MTDFTGEIAALTAALLWAVSSVVYGILGQEIPPLQLNLGKGIAGIIFIFLTLLFLNSPLPRLDLIPVSFLLLSGIIGIGLGDTAFFTALNNLGARRTLLIETLAPPMTALIALVFLQERLNYTAWLGIILTVSGVAWVISERNPDSEENKETSMKGIIWAVLAAVAQANGAVLSRFALIESNFNPLLSTLIRLIGGTIAVSCLLPFSNNPREHWQEQFQSKKLLLSILIAAFFSTYLGIWLQQTSLKFSLAGIAQTLLATSPLFVLPIVVFRGETISWRAVLGALIAVGGIGVLFILT